MTWLDDIDGIKDIVDLTGETPTTLPRYGTLAIEGTGIELTPDPVAGATRLHIHGAPDFTPVKTAPYAAAYDQLVRAGVGASVITLPSAAAQVNGRVGVINVGGGAVSVAPSGGNTLQDVTTPYAINAKGSAILVQSDGVSAWWIIAKV
jgi:hypothetical protein